MIEPKALTQEEFKQVLEEAGVEVKPNQKYMIVGNGALPGAIRLLMQQHPEAFVMVNESDRQKMKEVDEKFKKMVAEMQPFALPSRKKKKPKKRRLW